MKFLSRPNCDISFKTFIMFSINKQSDYALITIYHLKDEENFVPLSYLIEKTHMPKRFLARITADLVRNGILLSKEGKSGGYKLAKNPDRMPLYDFLKIFEDDLSIVSCSDNGVTCECNHSCHHQKFFKKTLTGRLADELKSWTVEDTFA